MSAPVPDTPSLITVEEFLALPEEEPYLLELAAGGVVREPAPGPAHGRLEVRLAVEVEGFVQSGKLGAVFTNTGFVLARDPDTVRVPDLSFVAAERIPEEGESSGFWELAPDLVVEILSPDHTASEIQEKVREYLHAGCRMIWVVDPEAGTVAAHHAERATRILSGAEELDGADVLPGFRLPLPDLFP